MHKFILFFCKIFFISITKTKRPQGGREGGKEGRRQGGGVSDKCVNVYMVYATYLPLPTRQRNIDKPPGIHHTLLRAALGAFLFLLFVDLATPASLVSNLIFFFFFFSFS
jgi:hypothetical protein